MKYSDNAKLYFTIRFISQYYYIILEYYYCHISFCICELSCLEYTYNYHDVFINSHESE